MFKVIKGGANDLKNNPGYYQKYENIGNIKIKNWIMREAL